MLGVGGLVAEEQLLQGVQHRDCLPHAQAGHASGVLQEILGCTRVFPGRVGNLDKVCRRLALELQKLDGLLHITVEHVQNGLQRIGIQLDVAGAEVALDLRDGARLDGFLSLPAGSLSNARSCLGLPGCAVLASGKLLGEAPGDQGAQQHVGGREWRGQRTAIRGARAGMCAPPLNAAAVEGVPAGQRDGLVHQLHADRAHKVVHVLRERLGNGELFNQEHDAGHFQAALNLQIRLQHAGIQAHEQLAVNVAALKLGNRGLVDRLGLEVRGHCICRPAEVGRTTGLGLGLLCGRAGGFGCCCCCWLCRCGPVTTAATAATSATTSAALLGIPPGRHGNTVSVVSVGGK
eukprot:m.300702 g.300702  ORF g.300702 m.300702 type:complete len:348 (-) comp55214_c0_seq3:102-1145(-)